MIRRVADRLPALLDKSVQAQEAPGLSVVAFDRDNGIIASAYAGVRDVESKKPWDEHSVFWPARRRPLSPC